MTNAMKTFVQGEVANRIKLSTAEEEVQSAQNENL